MGLRSANETARQRDLPLVRRSDPVAWNSLFMATAVLIAAALACTNAARGSADPDRFLWKSVPTAQCKLDDKIPLAWNVYQTDNKKQANLALILLGRRYLAIDIKAKKVYTVMPTDLTARGSNWESGDLFVESRVLPTDNWTLRDVGPAELVRLTLNDYGRTLQIELPHPADLRAFY
jgi:hypothetical protein